MRARRQHGFTLIELMVTLTIVGLLMMAVLPSMMSWMRDLRIRNAAESIQNGLQRARMEALRTNGPVSMWLVSDVADAACTASSSSSAWVVAVNDPAGACTSDTAGIVEKNPAGRAAANVTVTAEQTTTAAATTSATRVMFNGFGQLATPGGGTALNRVVVKLTRPSESDARPLWVEVLSGGSIRMCDPNVAATDPRHCTTL